MSTYNPTAGLADLQCEPGGVKPLSRPAEDKAASAAPCLDAVMRSSRARAWIPPHLIESLRARR